MVEKKGTDYDKRISSMVKPSTPALTACLRYLSAGSVRSWPSSQEQHHDSGPGILLATEEENGVLASFTTTTRMGSAGGITHIFQGGSFGVQNSFWRSGRESIRMGIWNLMYNVSSRRRQRLYEVMDMGP